MDDKTLLDLFGSLSREMGALRIEMNDVSIASKPGWPAKVESLTEALARSPA